MKLLTAEQIRAWDEYTIQHEPVTSIDLMERAATACADYLEKHFLKQGQLKVKVICGKGNNGGDGLAIARLLANKGVSIEVFVLDISSGATTDFQTNEQRGKEQGGVNIKNISSEHDFPVISKDDLVIDAIFGTGLNKPLEGLARNLVNHINTHSRFTISIDIPTGLKAEVYSREELERSTIVKAAHTLTFQVPKQSFMYAETFPYVGEFHLLDIGLKVDFLKETESRLRYITRDHINQIIKPRLKFSHKGTFGHALLIGGSFGKMGAVILMSRAGLRSGCGLVTSYIPKVGYTVLQTALPECMVNTDDELYEIRRFPHTSDYDAIGVGPGLGTNEYTVKNFQGWLHTVDKPCVIDADALNICSRLLLEHHETFHFPKECIITPHPREFDRMAGFSKDSMERMEKQVYFAQKYNIIVVLKGAHTSIALPNGEVYFNSTGNPAMATAGSGDALTGMITSFLAQGYPLNYAAFIGVYFHGRAGDLAAEDRATIITGDLVEAIPYALEKG